MFCLSHRSTVGVRVGTKVRFTVKIKTGHLYSSLSQVVLVSKALRMSTTDHTFYLPPTRLSTNGTSHPAFDPQLQRITALWPVLIFCATEDRRLSSH